MQPSVKIIGRRREKETLLEYFEATRGGKGNILFITGEAGIGKTLLAEGTLGESDLNVFITRTTEGVSSPYGPLVTILRQYLRKTSSKTIDCGNLTPFLSFLLPELGQKQDQPDAETLTETLLSSLKTVIQNKPTVFFLDDLHWADNATLDILPLIAERLNADPLLVLAAYRSDEIPRGHRLRRMRHELRRRRMLQEITLEPMHREDTRRLIERTTGESPGPSLTDLIYEKTSGVPLFIEELASVLAANDRLIKTENGLELPDGENIPVPDSIRDAVLLRLDGLSGNAYKLLEVASVAGIEFDFELLSKIAGKDEALGELLTRSWITERVPGLGVFRHGLMREVIYHHIIWSRRRLLHCRIAEYLETAGGLPEQIAEHWVAAGEKHKARKALLAYADRSCALHAYHDAARAAHQALEHWQEGEDEELRLQTLERLAQCAQLNGQLNDAVRTLGELVESTLIKENTHRYAEAQRALATVYGLQGAWESFLVARLAAAEAFEQAGIYGEAAVELLSAATKNSDMSNLPPAIDQCDQAYELCVKAGRQDIQARILALKGDMLTAAGNPGEGIAMIHTGLSIALEQNLSEAASDAYKRLADSLATAAEYTSAREAYHSAYNYCRTQGDHLQAQLCLGCMAYVLFRTGDWNQCSEICLEVINDPDSFDGALSVALCVFGFFHTYRGTLRTARKNMKKSMQLGRKLNIESVIIGCLEGFALLDEYEGEEASAAEYYRQLMKLREKIDDVHETLPALCSAVTFFATRGMEKETLLCLKALTDMAKVSGNNENLGVLAYALGETALLHNDPREAIHQFEQASNHFEKLKIPLERLKAEWRLGVACRRNESKEQAVAHLRFAYQSAKNLGCRPLASQIADELDALGLPAEEQRSPEAASRATYGGLTHRQVEVLRLISGGLTNKEIARKLFLSPRTVEMHVANILNRLNCRSRLEAVRNAENMRILD